MLVEEPLASIVPTWLKTLKWQPRFTMLNIFRAHSIPFLYLLIPDMRMTDKVDDFDQDKSEREELELQAPLVANSDGGSDDDDAVGLLRNPSD